MDKNIYFKEWIHKWNLGMRTALFLILLFTIIQFSLFSLTQNYVVSYFGAQPEDVTFSIQVTYISLLFTLPLQIRFELFQYQKVPDFGFIDWNHPKFGIDENYRN